MKGLVSICLALTFLTSAGADEVIERREVDGVVYHVAMVPAERLRLLWKDGEGRAMRTFPAVAAELRRRGDEPLMLMNGGIYEPGGIPSGLFIQDGKVLNPVNRRDGKGNFFLKPNGIFLIDAKGARVIDTAGWGAADGVKWAVQSGPLLLRKGKVHPAFREHSENRLHRNGVGVRKDGMVVLAMSDGRSAKWPNLHGFATFFQKLGCEDALFLDGDISAIRVGKGMDEPSQDYGTFVAVVAAE
ncbi:MAG: phosphodiester glycosidase family protein [Akkermansiaceae bacterium]|jgi:uncharacterized protein YigE (DUF2233 family)|nr:phosphodiester glycosidase family protein [Akkermansiaceae bacterium]